MRTSHNKGNMERRVIRMDGPIPGRRPRIRPHSTTKVIWNARNFAADWTHFLGVNIDGCRKVMKILLASEYNDFIRIHNPPCRGMRDIEHFHAHTDPHRSLGLQRYRQNQP